MKLIFIIQYIQSSIQSTYKQYESTLMSHVTLFFLTEAGKSDVSLALKAPLGLDQPRVKRVPAT